MTFWQLMLGIFLIAIVCAIAIVLPARRRAKRENPFPNGVTSDRPQSEGVENEKSKPQRPMTQRERSPR